MNKTTIDETIAWIDKRPEWLVTSINLLFKNNRPFSQNEINDLADKCIKEAKSKKGKTEIDKKAFSTYFGTNTNKGTVQLKSLSNIKGINNLNPKEPLELSSDNITIVYGRNGSGKSGYVRILKKACGARKTEDLLCDVFKGKESQECDFEIIKNGKTEKIKWRPQNQIENDLKTIDIFDTSSGISYVMENNEVTYEPPVLKFLTYLSETTDKVNSIVVEKINKLSPTLPSFPANLQNTAIFKKYKSLSNTGNAGHSIPPSPDKIEHPPTRHKNLNIRLLIPNIGWLTFSVFGGLNHPAHPSWITNTTKSQENSGKWKKSYLSTPKHS